MRIGRDLPTQLTDLPQHLGHRPAVLDHLVIVAALQSAQPARPMAVEDRAVILQNTDALLRGQFSQLRLGAKGTR